MFVRPPIIMPPDDDENTGTVWPTYDKEEGDSDYAVYAFVVGVLAIVTFLAALSGTLVARYENEKLEYKLDCIKLVNHQFIDNKCYEVKEIENMSKEQCTNITHPTMFKHGKCYLILNKENEQHTR